ncbi:hypothetical protein QFC21_000004 [Naganishia friedmannii]|uniref:Uncharacterized protein n=1 Tax=Naganishia friedmannii TaxID=89922 RepID=A0ACC2WAA6_9TREE|nr:hypothetical protein QFC21_000004 [Naganishia friedmannii]
MSAITAKSNPPFRAEHIGSLLRPAELLQHRYAVFADKTATPESLVPVEQAAIKEIVKVQQESGFHAITNGEFSRHQFWGTFFETLNGMEEVNLRDGGYDQSIFRMYAPDVKSFMHDKKVPNQVTVAVRKVSHTGTSSYLPEFEYMKTLVSESEWKNIKITLASPSWYHFRYGPKKAYAPGVYANDDEYFADVAKAYQTELKILYHAGVRNVQVDDPNLAYFCSEAMLEGWKKDKENFQSADEQFAAYIKFYNACFQRADDMHLGIHLCRGNYIGGRHFSEGAYDRIARQLFTDLDADTFYLEYDTARAGGFEPLKHLPLSKNVVLGVVTSKHGEMEDKQEMVDRVYKAAEYVAEGNNITKEEALKVLCVSPQCGFGSHAEGNPISHEDMVKKLKLVRAIADQVWPGQP